VPGLPAVTLPGETVMVPVRASVLLCPSSPLADVVGVGDGDGVGVGVGVGDALLVARVRACTVTVGEAASDVSVPVLVDCSAAAKAEMVAEPGTAAGP